ncbi:DUF3237 domain-containing protein [Chitinophaga arvensicola]|uniref:UPF0311 protein SAMN04488122_2434 n=1 Tax=Chitinophaga arvensicola TaxID=29529 RepID=A0A1I0R7Z7_9BACT|nr:DUF3237 domain-containing protein [Chitinophaga arvensicola]SEW36842.1 Protein of unknown function [Chitinophaga arvensicola]
MKKVAFLALFFSISIFVHAQELQSEFLFDFEISLHPPQAIGKVLTGTRLIYPFKDGQVKGDKINGKVLDCGGEWGLVVDSSTFKMDVRATIQTNDGALIYIAYSGYNYASGKNAVLMREGKGSELSPSDYYFRSVPVFETSSPKYAWLNHTVAVGVGRFPSPGKIIYRIYAIK